MQSMSNDGVMLNSAEAKKQYLLFPEEFVEEVIQHVAVVDKNPNELQPHGGAVPFCTRNC